MLEDDQNTRGSLCREGFEGGEQHDDDCCSYQRCHLRVVEEVHGDGDLLPNTPGPDRCKHGRQADVALLLVQREVKELMAWGSRAKRKL